MKSTSNNNGRVFEYLITKYLSDEHSLTLTERALKDQSRDSTKLSKIRLPDLVRMQKSMPIISDWLEKKITLEPTTFLDRLPDKDINDANNDHSDLKIYNAEVKIGLSVKYNHYAVFHGRPYNLPVKCGFDSESQEAKNFSKKQYERSDSLKEKILPGTVFADKGILKEYQKDWGEFMKDIVTNQADFLNSYSQHKSFVESLFKTILGFSHGNSKELTYRLILLKKILIFEDLTFLTFPKSLQARAVQEGIEYQWFLYIQFDNGLIIKCRHKHDDRVMSKIKTQIKIKPDWQVEDWGNCGMSSEIIDLIS